MFSRSSSAALLTALILTAGCGGSEKGTSNSANAGQNVNAVTSATVAPANLPPEFSGASTTPPANAPGIPTEMKPLPKGATPTPGIPSEAELKKPFKPGATPTPGIPDPETIRKALEMRQKNVNLPEPSGGSTPMMKSNRKTGGKVQ